MNNLVENEQKEPSIFEKNSILFAQYTNLFWDLCNVFNPWTVVPKKTLEENEIEKEKLQILLTEKEAEVIDLSATLSIKQLIHSDLVDLEKKHKEELVKVKEELTDFFTDEYNKKISDFEKIKQSELSKQKEELETLYRTKIAEMEKKQKEELLKSEIKVEVVEKKQKTQVKKQQKNS